MRLHYFYPENDIALALDNPGFTPSRAAAQIHLAGEALPMWYGEPGDRFVTSGVDARWFDAVCADFGPLPEPYAFSAAGLEPAPWGWSLPVRRKYLELGFAPDTLPSPAAIEAMRQLSHRRTCSRLVGDMAASLPFPIAPAAVEAFDAATALSIIEGLGTAVVKQPWSSSGRGIAAVTADPRRRDDTLRRLAGIIRRQGSVMIEPLHTPLADFALLFDIRAGRVSFTGLSLFSTDSRFAYTGNTVASDHCLRLMLAPFVDPARLDMLADAAADALARIVGTAYDGPLGVDMMATASSVAVCEMNLRTTMGHVAHALASRFLAPGLAGTYSVTPVPTPCTPVPRSVSAGRLVAGELDLVPPGSPFRFVLKAGG